MFAVGNRDRILRSEKSVFTRNTLLIRTPLYKCIPVVAYEPVFILTKKQLSDMKSKDVPCLMTTG